MVLMRVSTPNPKKEVSCVAFGAPTSFGMVTDFCVDYSLKLPKNAQKQN